jgi:hypothetical protein
MAAHIAREKMHMHMPLLIDHHFDAVYNYAYIIHLCHGKRKMQEQEKDKDKPSST